MKIRIDATREEVETGCYLAQDCFHCPLEYRLLRACDYGAPTIRKRFFLIARCDGQNYIKRHGVDEYFKQPRVVPAAFRFYGEKANDET